MSIESPPVEVIIDNVAPEVSTGVLGKVNTPPPLEELK
jgi:hypothetical protein